MTKGKSKNPVSIGDVFAVSLPDGRYGAIRVADQIDNSYLIITTPYLGTEIPSIENELLGDILLQNRFFYNNDKALIWVEGKKPNEVVYIGNIPVSGKIICSSFGGKWDKSVGIAVFLEWLWEYDRENFEKEIQEEEKRINVEYKKSQEPKKMMKDETFWTIISLLNFNDENDEEEILEPAVHTLAKMSVKDIKEFEEALAYKLYLLDTKEHAKNIGEYSYDEENQNYFSPDLFLYFRCSVITEGKEFFEITIKNPQNMSQDNSFEPLLSLASEAYTRRTGKEFEYITGCDIESFSNIEGWR
ncbi:DUF4240 domain-containing protein [Cytobacillus sp. Sa5YUA1]|uniref:DUF4240 domain-containing protein n=1 Tax=Cytobacillus stercorigallinarum TaxID=2762240 RepID=A0ABR8QNN2_9BACI|nr:DUF4240 domain-containing protein [Cytobacillus stercorigallinarum]MBD7937123.1 DUF4240 domain-containing protein [Cytobacillus stercorigallinarum]